MILFDGHIHTEYCGHAPGMTVETIVNRINELGLESAVISEHIFSNEDVKLLNLIKEQLNIYTSICEIFAGAEVDADSKFADGRLVVDNDTLKTFDYIIGAIHYIPLVGNYPHSSAENPLPPDELLKRWQSTLFGVVNNPHIDVLAHPGRLPAAALDLDIYFDDILAVLAQAAEISANNNIFWEMNNLTCGRLKKEHFALWHKTIQVAIDAGVKITYGSDAHAPVEISKQGYVQQMLTKLKGLGKLYSPLEIMEIRNG